jgi:hypothetical protein
MSRTVVINEIISELEKITGDEDIKIIKEHLELASLELEVEKYHESIKLPTAICGVEEKEIKEKVKDACKDIKEKREAIRTRISPISGEYIPNTAEGNNRIKGMKINIHQLNKYLAIVYLLKEELIELDQYNVLVRNLRKNKIGGFNKRRRETRKNKSKRKKSKNKSKRKKSKNKSTRKTKH